MHLTRDRVLRLISNQGNPPDQAFRGAIRALSIRQPWAWAILHAGKRVENRTWYTAYRGPIYLHAALRVDYDAIDGLAEVIAAINPRPPAYRGAIVGKAELVDCVPAEDVPEDQDHWAMGPWCFILENITALSKPVAMRGSLGLFTVEPRAELEIAMRVEVLQSYG